MRKPDTNNLWAVKLARHLAQEQGLPMGNLWEPPIAHQIEEDLSQGNDRSTVVKIYRLRLGL